MTDPLHLIEELEKMVDEAVKLLLFPLICAYDGEKMPGYLQTLLLETHPYVLIEDELIVSEQYQPIKRSKYEEVSFLKYKIGRAEHQLSFFCVYGNEDRWPLRNLSLVKSDRFLLN